MRRTGRASHCLPLHVLPGLLLLVALVPCNLLLPGLPAFPLLICQLLLAVPLPLALRGSRGRSSRLSSLLRLYPLLRLFGLLDALRVCRLLNHC